MSEVTPDAWRLFWNTFKQGEHVVIVTDVDEFFWGRLGKVTGDGLMLDNPEVFGGKFISKRVFLWDEIRFMAHDGFPVRRLMGADGSKSIERINTGETYNQIRQLLKTPSPSVDYELIGHGDVGSPLGTAVFGDPFIIEGVSMKLLNPGNAGGEYWEDHPYEEVIVCKAKDGAMGLLYELSTIYHFDVG